MRDSYDAAVIGAGVFGAWTAYYLRRSGRTVALLDAYGPANSRASSGDESRVLRMGYGPDEIYTRWALRSRELWIALFDEIHQPELFQRTGVLWATPPNDPRAASTRATFQKCGVRFESLTADELAARYPQIRFPNERVGTFEPDGGAVLARRAVQALVQHVIREGVDFLPEAAMAPQDSEVKTLSGASVRADLFVYACGPWLPKVFPQVLEGRIRPTRQEMFFFGTPPGDAQFAPPQMPVWLDFSDERGPYALPSFENRGLKFGFDRHGPAFDPDTGDRIATGAESARAFIAERFPALAGAPVVESRVCQYENTSTGDFLIDRHPDLRNVWLVGGGSGHGFKHGPAVGEYVSQAIASKVVQEPRFSLETKAREAKRAVY